MTKRLLSILLTIVLITILTFYCGFIAGEQQGRKDAPIAYYPVTQPRVVTWYKASPPEIITQFVDRPVVQHHIVYSDMPDLRFFQSRDELREWVSANLVEDIGKQRCVAEALEMQRRAIRDGYQVSVQALFDGRVQPAIGEWDVAVSAFIGRDMFLVWPVSGKVRWAGQSLKNTFEK